MLRSITCAALAAMSFGVFAQSSDGQKPGDETFCSDIALMTTPPSIQNSVTWSDKERNVRMQAEELNGTDRFQLFEMMDRCTGDVDYDLVKALYSLRNEADVARHDVLAQCISNNTMMAQAGSNDFSEIGNRPMRMVLGQPSNNPNITYEDAADIIEHELSHGEVTTFDEWYWHQASDADRDTLVHAIRLDNWLKNRPVYVSTLGPDIASTIPATTPAFPPIPFTSGQ